MVVFRASALLFAMGLASRALSAAMNNQDASTMLVIPSCNLFYQVQEGDTCWDIVSRNANTFTIQQLLCWNPDINAVCSNLIPGRDVCVGVANAVYCDL